MLVHFVQSQISKSHGTLLLRARIATRLAFRYLVNAKSTLQPRALFCFFPLLAGILPGPYTQSAIRSYVIVQGGSSMSSSPSVTTWIGNVKAGDREAAQRLWERYSARLVRLARARLPAARRRAADEEDVALSAMDSFLRAAERGRFPDLHGRDSLWALLVTITVRKAWKLARRTRELGESALGLGGDESQEARGWEQVLGREPTPEIACQMAERCRTLLEQLNPELQSIALWKLEGFTNAEIAERLGRVVGTVERKLRVIRTIWEKEMVP
jgi:DNA-directed RNA polymerase specialized sigma24 family protein